jgi:hypothetical protein
MDEKVKHYDEPSETYGINGGRFNFGVDQIELNKDKFIETLKNVQAEGSKLKEFRNNSTGNTETVSNDDTGKTEKNINDTSTNNTENQETETPKRHSRKIAHEENEEQPVRHSRRRHVETDTNNESEDK